MLKFLLLLLALGLLLCASCVGCVSCVSCRIFGSWLDEAKEVFHLNADDITQISNGVSDYTVLDETVSREELGGWMGTVRRLAVVDSDGRILKQKRLPALSVSSYAELADGITGAAFVVPFLNVYHSADGESYLYVDVNGTFHKAVPSDEVTDADVLFNFREAYAARAVHCAGIAACG